MKYSRLYRDDLQSVRPYIINRDRLKCRSLFITGATGLIGSAIVDQLLDLNDSENMCMKIHAGVRSIKKARDRFGDLSDRGDLSFVEYDALKPVEFKEHADYIIHAGSPGVPGEFSEHPVETMMANILGLHNLFLCARECGADRLLFISSSEIYGNLKGNLPFKEEDSGFVDLLSPRSCYPYAKRAAETLCVSHTKEYGVDSVIVRPGHIYGPTASPQDNRVSSAFVYDALNKKPIVLKSDGSQIRSYCYAADCASAILTVLLNGESSTAYNVANKISDISIRQLAEIIARSAGVEMKFDLPDQKEKQSFNVMKRSSLDAKRLLGLGWKPVFDAQTGIQHTIDILKQV